MAVCLCSIVNLYAISFSSYPHYFSDPKDSTSGCACEARDFSAALSGLSSLGVKVFGVSRDDVASHDKFVAEESITFPLIADIAGDITEAYGVYKLRNSTSGTCLSLV
jgi:thioredoxin-dependent peroxiredoxin